MLQSMYGLLPVQKRPVSANLMLVTSHFSVPTQMKLQHKLLTSDDLRKWDRSTKWLNWVSKDISRLSLRLTRRSLEREWKKMICLKKINGIWHWWSLIRTLECRVLRRWPRRRKWRKCNRESRRKIKGKRMKWRRISRKRNKRKRIKGMRMIMIIRRKRTKGNKKRRRNQRENVEERTHK